VYDARHRLTYVNSFRSTPHQYVHVIVICVSIARDVMGAIPLFEKTVTDHKQAPGARLLFYIYEHGVKPDGTIRQQRGGLTPDEESKLLLKPSPQQSRYWLKQAAELGDGDSQWAYTLRALQAARRAEGAEVAGRRATAPPSEARALQLRSEAVNMLSLHIRHSLSQRIGREWEDSLYSGALQSSTPMRELQPAVWMWAQLGVRGIRQPGSPSVEQSEDLLEHLRAAGYTPPDTMINMLPQIPPLTSHDQQ
jgi:TPR repeat protein